MDKTTIEVITKVLTVLVLVGFAVMYGAAVYVTIRFGAPTPPETGIFTGGFVYVGTALAGLVAGIVAADFGQQVPETPGLTTMRRLRVMMSFKGDSTQKLAAAYASVYFVVGALCIAAFVIRDEAEVPDMIRNLALVSIGLILAIVRTAVVGK